MDDFEILIRLFSSRIRTKLLKFFLTMPESGYFIRELARNIGEDAKNISRELNNLENIGLLKGEKRGLQKFYSIRTEFLFYRELKAVFLKSSGLEGLFREVLGGLEGIERAYMKETLPSEGEPSAPIKLLIVGLPDMPVLNDSVNTIMERIGREIIYRCYGAEEFDERSRMDDAYIVEVSAGEKIM